MSRDLWKPALMTFRTFYVKIIWKTPKELKKMTYLYIALKPIHGDIRIKLAIVSD